jgi:signal-transduction protein with cAMP-binding, CBS, and nucleotidyltransferase domain
MGSSGGFQVLGNGELIENLKKEKEKLLRENTKLRAELARKDEALKVAKELFKQHKTHQSGVGKTMGSKFPE